MLSNVKFSVKPKEVLIQILGNKYQSKKVNPQNLWVGLFRLRDTRRVKRDSRK